MPLEALWSAEDVDAFTTARDESRWDWTLMNLVADWIAEEHVDAAREAAARRGSAPALDAIRLAWFEEGLSVRTLHVGPDDEEGPVLERMHGRYIPEARSAGCVLERSGSALGATRMAFDG